MPPVVVSSIPLRAGVEGDAIDVLDHDDGPPAHALQLEAHGADGAGIDAPERTVDVVVDRRDIVNQNDVVDLEGE